MFQLVANGLESSSALRRLALNGLDPAVLRPFLEEDKYGNLTGRSLITMQMRHPNGNPVFNEKREPVYRNFVTNAPATLRQQDWLRIDEVVRFTARNRLRLWGDLRAAVPLNVPGGMGTIAIQHAVATGRATATISMDPIKKGERSRPILDTTIIPMPTIHSDGTFSARDIAVSLNGSMPLNTTALRLAAEEVMEQVEALALGTASSYTYAGGTVYGITNFPQRSTKVMTTPTGANGATTIAEILDMLQTLRNNRFFGPYVVYYSNNWNQWMDRDYSIAGSSFMTLRQRLQAIEGISAWRSLDLLTGYQIIIVQLTDDIVEAAEAMPLTTVQWEEQGGFEQCFKVVCINVPRVKANYDGVTGIIHGTAP